MPSAFFLLSNPEPGPEPKLRAPKAAAVREVEGLLARPGCCTLLLYNQSGCSNYVSDQWS
jgi:hypothetical protein